MVHIVKIEPSERGSRNSWTVYYRDAGNDPCQITVYATDELAAFVEGKKLIEEKSMTARIFWVCMTTVLLCLIGVSGYGCQQKGERNQQYFEACLKSNKSYASGEYGPSCK